MQRDSLLNPTLRTQAPRAAIYSMRAQFLTAFFGGPIAIAYMCWQNAALLGRRNQDGRLILGFAVLTVLTYLGVGYWLGLYHGDGSMRMASREIRMGMRLLGLAFLGVAYLRVRAIYRTIEISEGTWKNPWRTALIGLVVSMGVSFLATTFGALIARTMGAS